MASPANIPALVRHLRSGSPAQQLRASAALAALACQSASSTEAIVDAGGIAALASCLRHSRSTAVSKAAAEALGALSRHSPTGVGDFAPVAAAIPNLVSMMAVSSRPELQQAACIALSKLVARSEPLVSTAAEAGAVPAAVQLLRSCRPALVDVVMIVIVLTKGSAERSEAFATAGGITALLQCLLAADAGGRACVLGALGHVALSSLRASRELVQAGGIPVLAQHLKASQSSDCQRWACTALANLATCSDDARLAILAADVMPVAVQLLTSFQPELQAAGAGLIGSLCVSERGVQQAQQAGAIPALLRVLGEGEHGEGALLWAARAISKLAGHLATAAALVAAGAIPLLQQLAGSTANQDVRDMTSASLTHLLDVPVSTAQADLPTAGGTAAQLSEAAPRPPTTCAAPGCTNTQRLHRCGGCRSVRYCGEACRNAHWREHKAECRRLQAVAVAVGEEGQSTAAA